MMNGSNVEGTDNTTTRQNDTTADSLLLGMISFFTKFNPSTIYVITQGVKGAIAFRNQTIIAQVIGTVNVTLIPGTNLGGGNDIIIDPTGAGDAFCAGFFHSLWQSIQYTTVLPTDIDLNNSILKSLYRPSEQYWPKATAIQDALLYGCTIGTCSVLQRGGSSVPPSDHNLVQIIHEQNKELCTPISNGVSQDHR